MDTHDQDQDETGSKDSEVKAGRQRRRSAIGLAAGLTVGLAAAAGIGLAVQSAGASPAPQANEHPMGAQLPWDESEHDMSKDGVDRPHGDHGRLGALHDRMHRRMDDAMASRQGGRDGQGRGVEGRGGEIREMLAIAAEELGITVEEFTQGLKNGESIADIAQQRDVPVQDVIDALVDHVTANATERITELVNRSLPFPRL